MIKFRRLCVMLLCLAFLTVALIACSSDGPDSADGKQPPVANEEDQTDTTDSKDDTEDQESVKKINGGEPVLLRVNLHTWNPTINDTPTKENPRVFKSPEKLAEEFMELHPNVEIEWVRQPAQSDAVEFYTTQVAAGTAPVIAYSNVMNDRGWNLPLNDIIETPNEYIEGNEKWKDIYPDYLWSMSIIRDAKGDIFALPVALNPGPPTAYYYNKEIFEEVGVQPPKDWEEFIEICEKIRAAGYIPVAPWEGERSISHQPWDIKFSIGPSYVANFVEVLDYDKDGLVVEAERMRAAAEGYFDTTKHEYAREVFIQYKRKINDVLTEGWETTDYAPLWNEGKLAMKQDGLWILNSELSNTERKFEFGMFPQPVVTKSTSENVGEIKFTEKGPYQPGPSLFYNILKPAVEKEGQGALEAAIAFLKFITVPENLSAMVLEDGNYLGAVKGTAIPASLQDWVQNSFPIIPEGIYDWPGSFSSEITNNMAKELEMFVKGMTDEEEFFKKWNELQRKSVQEAVESLGIDTSDWNIDE